MQGDAGCARAGACCEQDLQSAVGGESPMAMTSATVQSPAGAAPIEKMAKAARRLSSFCIVN